MEYSHYRVLSDSNIIEYNVLVKEEGLSTEVNHAIFSII